MKTILIFVLAISLFSCSSQKANSPINIPANPMPVGEITRAALIDQYPNFNSNRARIYADKVVIDELKRMSTPTEVTVVFGTWCHDSKREVPRLLALLDEVNNPNITLRLVTVKYDKRIPEDFDQRFAIRYTPTIFITQDNKVIGTIIERPKDSLAEDLLAILQRN